MSGLEVAGVVLGALPLVISALEHYVDGIQTAKRYFRYKSELRSLILQINTERGMFINTLEQLLGGIVRIEHMAGFLSSPGGEAWKDASVDARLRDRLRGAYQVYLDNVTGMERSMTVMMEKLALDFQGKPQFIDPNLFKQEFKRLKFSLSKSEYSEQLSELRICNQALTRLTQQSLDLAPSRTETRFRSCPNFNALQRYAHSLFNTLQSGLQCSCDGHAVKLRLENRSQMAESEDDLLKSTQFRVIFSYTPTASASTPTWREADIRWIAERPKSIPLPTRQSTTHKAAKISQQVRFGQVESQTSNGSTTVTVDAHQTSITTSSVTARIPDLCQAIATLHQARADACAGFLVDSLQRKHGIYPCSSLVNQNDEQKWTAYTLRQILTKQDGFGRPLMQRDTYKVAVDLASSVLQLYKTPWLSDDWGDADVYFVRRPGAPLATVYQHPFIYHKFSTTTHVQYATVQLPIQRVIRNKTLFTLGVLLIELLYSTSIEALQAPQDLNCQGTPGVVWCTAERLIDEEIALQGGQLYADAVRRCIRCDFNQTNASLSDEGFQQAVYDGVIAPLEKTLRHWNGED